MAKKKRTKTIPMKKLKGGQIGITDEGYYVQRSGNWHASAESEDYPFIIIGYRHINILRESGKVIEESNGYSRNCSLPVRVLKDGEKITVKYRGMRGM